MMRRCLSGFAMLMTALTTWTLCFAFTGSAQQKGGQQVSVYVAALKGECQPGWQQRPAMSVNGRSVVMAPSAMPPATASSNPPTILTRFLEDPTSKHLAEEEFRKYKTFRVVNSPAQADFVFCVCSQYRELKIPPEVQARLKMPTTLRIGTQAGAVSLDSYLKTPNDAIALDAAAVWKSDNLTPEPLDEPSQDKKKRKDTSNDSRIAPMATFNGQPVGFQAEVLPYDLARRFIKRWPEFAAKLTTQSNAPTAIIVDAKETPLPTLKTDSFSGAKESSVNADAATADSETLRIDTALVVVPVMAMDRDGKYLPGLKAVDFEVYEDGANQEVSDFGSAEQPVHVALILDVSGSTRFKLEDIQDAALSFVDQLRPQDRVMVMSFDEQVRVDAEFTNERDKLMRAILRTRPGGGTRLVDAMDLALTERLNKIQGRKAIVVFTDGVDNSSWLTDWQGLTGRLEESDVLVYPVRYDTLPEMATPPPGFNTAGGNHVRVTQTFGNSKKDYERAVQNLKQVATDSGGRYHEVATISDIKQAFASVADELRRYYWLGYYPENITRDGRYRKIRVTVSQPGAVIRTRAGYRPGGGNETEAGEKQARPALKNNKP